MGSITDFLANELLDHALNNAAYTAPTNLYLGLSLAFSIRNGSYQWTASGSGTNEYYLEANGGGDPGLAGDPGVVIEDDTDMAAGTLGSLSAGEYGFGDNDSLGFDTIYTRLTDGADPDSKAADYLLAGGNPFDDGSGLNEPGSGSYGRVEITFGLAASRRVTQDADCDFSQATGAWGWATHYVIADASGTGAGNELAFGKLGQSKQVVSGNTPSVVSGEVYVEFSAGEISNYLANELLDHVFNNAAFTPPATTHVALTTAAIADTDTGSTITEPGSGAYARKEVQPNGGSSPTWDLAASGVVDNGAAVTFATATGSWGTITSVAICDASSAGNVLFYDNAMTDQAVGTDDTAEFATGDLDVVMT